MTQTSSINRARWLSRVAPGLPALIGYDFSADFRSDLVAGLSVAAVALPVAAPRS